MTTQKLNDSLALTFATQRMLATTQAEFEALPEQTRMELRVLAADTLNTLGRSLVQGRTAMFLMPEQLHPRTANLVTRFAEALAETLAAAEAKHGYTTEWMREGRMDRFRTEMEQHITKGDPLDVAAYAAFLWHHGASTNSDLELRPGERAGLGWHWSPALKRLRFLFQIVSADGEPMAGMGCKIDGVEPLDEKPFTDEFLDGEAARMMTDAALFPFAERIPSGHKVQLITWETFIGEGYGTREDDEKPQDCETYHRPGECPECGAKDEMGKFPTQEEMTPRYLAEPEPPQY